MGKTNFDLIVRNGFTPTLWWVILESARPLVAFNRTHCDDIISVPTTVHSVSRFRRLQ